ASAMFEPSITMQSAFSRSHCAVVATPTRCARGSRSQAGAQTGHRAAVSNTGLILDPDHSQAGAEQLLDQVVLLVVQRCPAQTRDVEAAVEGLAGRRVGHLVGCVPGFLHPLSDALHRPIERTVFPAVRVGRAILDGGDASGVDQEAERRRPLWTERAAID